MAFIRDTLRLWGVYTLVLLAAIPFYVILRAVGVGETLSKVIALLVSGFSLIVVRAFITTAKEMSQKRKEQRERDEYRDATQTDLMAVCTSGDAEAVKRLLESGELKRLTGPRAGVAATDSEGQTALMKSAKSDIPPEIAKMLLEHGANIAVRDQNGRTALSFACIEGNAAVAEHLIQHGADVGATDEETNTDLHLACKNGNTIVAELLLQHGADINAKGEDGNTAIHFALGKYEFPEGNEGVIRLLLDRGADPNVKGRYKETPLHICAERGNEEALRLLLKVGGDVNDVSFLGTPLFHAIKHGHVNMVRMLLENGADPNRREDSYRQTPLMLAAKHDCVEAAKLLMKNGADPDATKIDVDSGARLKKKKLTVLDYGSRSTRRELERLICEMRREQPEKTEA